ncbi:MAG TPA: S46 family peptidase, partial [Caulobacteraceae bacterium]|nr:S46 family peptidase [Caulobacteraceae bacterium]
RLSYGKVDGWTDQGRETAPFTTFAGLYGRATGAEPYKLPARWANDQAKLDPTTVLDFATTNDIIGGGSGSPVVDAKGEIVGTAFDGNIHSIAGDFTYDGALNRTIAVSTAAISEALTKVYGADALAEELEGE